MAVTFNILTHILEDDEVVRQEIERLLDETELRAFCHFYDKPSKFLEVIKDDINICVIDHYLPEGLTGLEMVRAVKKRNKNSYIIVMTGQGSKKVVIEYMNAGASKYIDKDESNYLVRLIEELKTGLLEVKERIEYANFQQQLKERTIEGQRAIEGLMDKLK